jgi:spermidine synthase
MNSSPATVNSPSVLRREYLLVLGCFFLSGLSALLYQTVWMRQFAVLFGTSELAIATVLSAYMAGLALGSWVMGQILSTAGTEDSTRLIDRWLARPVWAYGFLEGLIAVGAMLVPPGLALIRLLQQQVLGGQLELPDAGGPAQSLFYAASAFVILLLPTACMGATLPLLSRSVIRRQEQIGGRVGMLYAMNTLGAVAGTLLAAFVLLPALGLSWTTWCGVLCNLVIVGLAWKLELAHTSAPITTAPVEQTDTTSPIDEFHGDWIAPVMLCSGLIAFTYEVLWARLLGHVIGGSVYAFATMLAAFLSGITLGSLIAGPLVRTRRAAWWGLMLAQLGTAGTALWVFSSLNDIPDWLASSAGGSSLATSAWLCGLLLLPGTICLGATFPCAVRLVTIDPRDVGAKSGQIYAWNTIGGVLGAFAAGFWIIPQWGFSGTLLAAVIGNVLLAWLTFCARRWSWHPKLAFGVVSVCAVLCVHPQDPQRLLAMSPLMHTSLESQQVSLRVGRSATVRVSEWQGFFLLQNNGLPEALIAHRGAPPRGIETHRWLSGLPLLARPQANSMLIVGLGGGGAATGIPNSVRQIDVIELEPEVLAANQELSLKRDDDPLSDERVRIILNDARGTLSLSSKQYDIIVSQPSHPWTSGASHLYTREFLQLAKQHLSPGGVMLQWMDAEFINPDLFHCVAATVLAEFPHVRLYQPSETALMFLASNQPLAPELELLQPNSLARRYPKYFSRMPLNGVNDLAATFLAETTGLRQLCQGVAPNTDDHNVLAFHSAAHKAKDHGESLREVLQPVDVLLHRDSVLWSDPQLTAVLNPALPIVSQNRAERLS